MPQLWLKELRKKEWKEHRNRVKTVEPCVKIEVPREKQTEFGKLTRLRKAQELIDFDNRLLYERLVKVSLEPKYNSFPPGCTLKSLLADQKRMEQVFIYFFKV